MGPQPVSGADVTVVMTAMTDKERPWVLEALDSVLAQTVKPREVLLYAAEGNTWLDEELERSAHPAECERLVRRHRIPLARPGAVRNLGCSTATTTWIAYLDGDDVWEPRKLERQLQAVRDNPSASFIGTDFVFIDAKGQRFGFANGSNPTPSSWMVRRDLMLEYPFEADTKAGEDYFWLRASKAASHRVRVPEPLVRYRIRGSSISSLQQGQTRLRRVRELAANYASYRTVRYPMMAATYLRYLMGRGTTYDV